MATQSLTHCNLQVVLFLIQPHQEREFFRLVLTDCNSKGQCQRLISHLSNDLSKKKQFGPFAHLSLQNALENRHVIFIVQIGSPSFQGLAGSGS